MLFFSHQYLLFRCLHYSQPIIAFKFSIFTLRSSIPFQVKHSYETFHCTFQTRTIFFPASIFIKLTIAIHFKWEREIHLFRNNSFIVTKESCANKVSVYVAFTYSFTVTVTAVCFSQFFEDHLPIFRTTTSLQPIFKF